MEEINKKLNCLLCASFILVVITGFLFGIKFAELYFLIKG